MTLPVVFTANGPSGYNLTKSLRFRSSASAYLNRTPSSTGNRKTWTYSTWVKRGKLATFSDLYTADDGTGGSDLDSFEFNSSDVIRIYFQGAASAYLVTTQVFRDPSAWYHLVLAVDTTQATSSNRIKLYVNGVQVTAFSTATYPSQNYDTYFNLSGRSTVIGASAQTSPSGFFDGYQAEINFIDGQQLTPSSFGSTNALTGVWQPAKYTGTYGTNGFYLPFTDNSSTTSPSTGNIGIGKDFSGNANYWTTNNISLASGTYSSLTSGSGTYTVPAGVSSLNYLVVAGGGGAGGNAFNGGGGAGGVLVGTMAVTAGQTIAYSIGAGGAGGTAANGSNGSNTTFGALTAIGGGAGGSSANGAGASGGSGGGGAGAGSGTGAAGAGTSGQGNNGGVGFGASGGLWGAGGGGGAGAVGVSGSSGQGGNGGAGYTWINGTTYAGGGGGAAGVGNTAGVGGSGGGGAGSNSATGTSGTANTGGGGGGASGSFTGGSGGSGIIIVGYGATTTYDSMTDVPTLTSATTANYCVMNPVDQSLCSVTNGNLSVTTNVGGYGGATRGTIGVSSGKWYWETQITANGGSAGQAPVAGIMSTTSPVIESGRTSYQYYGANGNKQQYTNGSLTTNTGYGATYTTGDIIGVALDMDAGTLTFYKNNSSQGTAFTGITGNFAPSIADPSTGGTTAVNFGQQGFTYTPPTGFVALNTYNLPTSTIVKGNTVMDATLYTGNGTSQSITNAAGYKPDLVWTKSRSNSNNHGLLDSVRGVSRWLGSNSTSAEDYTAGAYVTAFNSNGFTVGIGGVTNENGQTYVGWQWQAGQGVSSSNTSGSITSTVSVNASAGFSVVTYTGTGSTATIGHGLGVAPSMIIVKRRDAGGSGWSVYFTTLPAGYVLSLQSTNGQANSSGRFTTTLPTSSVFSVGTDSDLNGSGGTYVAYCWSEIAGFSKFGSYTGNGSTDGPFVYTGFRPKFIMFKNATTGATNWQINDSARDTYNVMNKRLAPSNSDAEATGYDFGDFLSNGFKIRQTDQTWNKNGDTYIYACFAENPFKNALAR